MEYIPAKQILSRNRNTAWFGTDYTMNLYRGCCHGCIYCDSRSACYGIEDFGRVRAKENALALLRDELRRKVRPGIVGMGSMSDPYNPFEGELQLTRHALELLDAYGKLGCGRSELERVDPALLVGVRSGQFGCEALVKNRRAFTRFHPELAVEPVSLEDIMVFTVKGDAR